MVHTHSMFFKQSSGAEYKQVLNKNFQEFTVIRLPSVRHSSELEEAISNTA